MFVVGVVCFTSFTRGASQPAWDIERREGRDNTEHADRCGGHELPYGFHRRLSLGGDTCPLSSVPPLSGAGMARRCDAGGLHPRTAAAALRTMAALIEAQCDASPDDVSADSGKGKGTGSPGTSSGTALFPGGGKGKGTGTSLERQGHGPGLVVDDTKAMEFKRTVDAAWNAMIAREAAGKGSGGTGGTGPAPSPLLGLGSPAWTDADIARIVAGLSRPDPERSNYDGKGNFVGKDSSGFGGFGKLARGGNDGGKGGVGGKGGLTVGSSSPPDWMRTMAEWTDTDLAAIAAELTSVGNDGGKGGVGGKGGFTVGSSSAPAWMRTMAAWSETDLAAIAAELTSGGNDGGQGSVGGQGGHTETDGVAFSAGR